MSISTLRDALRQDRPRYRPRDCPGHEPTLDGLRRINQGGSAPCCHCGLELLPGPFPSGSCDFCARPATRGVRIPRALYAVCDEHAAAVPGALALNDRPGRVTLERAAW